ncbi:ATP-binding cassette domain-containing protein [Spongiibacter taiwanensis]|uniref:oligopeptide/dipeptide ABC transporter ATP-binding protein n=1 Tax=Spongiibacter taiwanensis TaxID=1748242 RepID=UPI002035BFF4|nr:oligopeptide/dipeptide ABC transporter ATP-binding protein [Spongiibacter taiwanensis]USA43575.1 ATP-binding cassette domain-containing protein [Spongiibacter taiwanensis]
MSQPIVKMRDLRCHFDGPGGLLAAVDGVDLDIYPGEVLGLVGESGSGKSTLGRMIVGLQARSGGYLEVDGRSLPSRFSSGDFRFASRRVQMVFQDSYASMNPRMTILESLIEPLLATRVPVAEARARGRVWLDRVGLARAAAARYPHELSGGQRQRVGIARAFIAEPRLVICDEPVSALDVSVQAQIIELLQALQQQQGTAMLFIAHDLAVVKHLSRRTAVMYLGEVVELGDSASLFRNPQHPYSQTLIGAHLSADLDKRPALAASTASAPRRQPLAGDEGCRFAARCAHAVGQCQSQPPWLQSSQGENQAACHRLPWVNWKG